VVTVDQKPRQQPPKPQLVRKLEDKREDLQHKPRALRWLIVAAGFTLLAMGVVMMVLPGPAFVVIPLGLALLSMQFCWAGRLLDRSLLEADKAKRKAQETTTAQKVLTATGGVLAVGAVLTVWGNLGNVPVLPV
jgi:uncharacterized protein (TIGR02611 family)